MKITYPECQIEISAKELIALMKYEEDRKPRITVDTDFISSIGRNLTTENAHTKTLFKLARNLPNEMAQNLNAKAKNMEEFTQNTSPFALLIFILMSVVLTIIEVGILIMISLLLK